MLLNIIFITRYKILYIQSIALYDSSPFHTWYILTIDLLTTRNRSSHLLNKDHKVYHGICIYAIPLLTAGAPDHGGGRAAHSLALYNAANMQQET